MIKRFCRYALYLASTDRIAGIYPPIMGVALIWLFLASSLSAGAGAATPLPEFRKNVNEVQIEVVATDTVGRPVADLTVSDIEVLENGQSMRGFGLSRVEDLPVFATLIYDTSESNEKTWLRMQEPVSRFLRRTITDRDQLWIAAFDSRMRFMTQVKNPDQLQAALSVAPGRDNLTGFYDAIFRSLLELRIDAGQPRRAAMLVISDGEDNYSIHSLPEVIASAQRSKVSIYTIHANSRGRNGANSSLRTLTTSTGGRDFTVASKRELEEALADIDKELRSCYLLYYAAPENRTDMGFRRLSVTPAGNKRLRLQVKSGYYVPIDSSLQVSR